MSKRKPRILVTGAAGMLADSLVPALRRDNYKVLPTDINVSDPRCSYLDVRDLAEVRRACTKFRPTLTVHLAAETDLEKCESDRNHGFRTNTLGTHNIALMSRKLEIPMVYVSTAGVFDGEKKEPYTELDEPHPINIYGSSKLAGENCVKELVDEYFIIRAGWMIGGGYKDKKFVRKIMDQVRHGIKQIHAVTDKYGSPTYAPAFSKVVVKLIKAELFGTYHITCKGQCNRFDVAKEILSIIGRTDIELVPVTSDYFQQQYPAPRPKSEMLRNYMLELRGLDEMPTWQDGLRQYLRFHYTGFLPAKSR